MASIGTLNIVRQDAVGADYDRSFQLAKEFGATVFFIAPDSISAAIQGDPNRFDLNEIVEIKSKLSEAGLAFEEARDANGKHVITVDLNKKPTIYHDEYGTGSLQTIATQFCMTGVRGIPASKFLSGALTKEEIKAIADEAKQAVAMTEIGIAAKAASIKNAQTRYSIKNDEHTP